MNKLNLTNKVVTINKKQIPIIKGGFGGNNNVLTVKQIAEIHGVEIKHINETINKNIRRFKEDVDYQDLKKVVDLTDYSLLLELGYTNMQIGKSKNIYVLSERGYSKLIKIMDTDLAWQIHDELIDNYFKMKEIIQSISQEKQVTLTKKQTFELELARTQAQIEIERVKAEAAAHVEIAKYRLDKEYAISINTPTIVTGSEDRYAMPEGYEKASVLGRQLADMFNRDKMYSIPAILKRLKNTVDSDYVKQLKEQYGDFTSTCLVYDTSSEQDRVLTVYNKQLLSVFQDFLKWEEQEKELEKGIY